MGIKTTKHIILSTSTLSFGRWLFVVWFLFCAPKQALSQSLHAKYGSEFLRVGAGAKALSMGGAQAAITEGVSAAYWNPAGLRSVGEVQIMYMHSERFGGIVGYDYGSLALPLPQDRGVLALSFFRQGVDNIANTLDAWDPNRGNNGGPKANVEQYITRFSATDMAWYVSYASEQAPGDLPIYYGGSLKFIRQKLGPFAHAWGYSVDLGAQGQWEEWLWGIQWIDATTLRKVWMVNQDEFDGYEEVFGDQHPEGSDEYVRPSLRMGVARSFLYKEWTINAAFDLLSMFEGREAYYLNLGSWSLEPRLGVEGVFRERLSLRLGLTDLYEDPLSGWTMRPTLGMGVEVYKFAIDYGFMGFAGSGAELGSTHRVSVRLLWD